MPELGTRYEADRDQHNDPANNREHGGEAVASSVPAKSPPFTLEGRATDYIPAPLQKKLSRRGGSQASHHFAWSGITESPIVTGTDGRFSRARAESTHEP